MSCRALSAGRLLQFFHVNLLHAEQRRHYPSGFIRVGVIQQLAQHRGNDLPRETVLVFQPATLLRPFVSAFGQLSPVMVQFLL